MRIMMGTGVRNDWPPGALERQKGEAGAGVTVLLLTRNVIII